MTQCTYINLSPYHNDLQVRDILIYTHLQYGHPYYTTYPLIIVFTITI